MNQRQAQQEGYTFTGHFSSRDKESMKTKAAELRKNGNKAVLVTETADKYARGHSGGGWSVYWIESEANIAARREAKRQLDIKAVQNNIEKLKTQLLEAEARLDELTS